MDEFKYDYLDWTVITVHRDHEGEMTKSALEELNRFGRSDRAQAGGVSPAKGWLGKS